MRTLASAQRILDIQPIEGADAIEVASVLGWKVVVKKNEFDVGELVTYLEIDSWVPDSLAPFLSKSQPPREYNGVPGQRLRTIRLRGQISQGLVLPLTVEASEGADLTEILSIQKWDPPVPAALSGIARGNWPAGVPKTDEDRIQTFTEREWLTIRNYVYEVTEKLEGSSMTVGILNGVFTVCSRNINLVETETNTFWQVARKLGIEGKLLNQDLLNIVIQGELVGPGVQGNHYELKDHQFRVFNIIDLNQNMYLNPVDRQALARQLDLQHVPIIGTNLTLSGRTVDEILQFADGQSELNINKLREGLVFKRIDGPDHWKAVSNAYLAKQKD